MPTSTDLMNSQQPTNSPQSSSITATDLLSTIYAHPGPYTTVYMATRPLLPNSEEDTDRRWSELRRDLEVQGGPLEALNAIEARLSKQFDYHGRVVVLSRTAYRKNMAAAPPAWGHDDLAKHNALFTLAGVKPKDVVRQLPPLAEFEKIATGPDAIFWSAPKDKITKTMFARKLVGNPMYKELTIRNHNTTFKLAKLLDEM